MHWFRRGLLVAGLLALAITLGQNLPPEPRWSAPGKFAAFGPGESCLIQPVKITREPGVVITHRDGPANLHDYRTGDFRRSIPIKRYHDRFSPNRRFCYSESSLWDLETGIEVPFDSDRSFQTFSNDSQLLVLSLQSKMFGIDTATGLELFEIESTQVLPRGSFVCFLEESKTGKNRLRIWNTEKRQWIDTKILAQRFCYCEGDASFLAMINEKRQYQLWDLEKMKLMREAMIKLQLEKIERAPRRIIKKGPLLIAQGMITTHGWDGTNSWQVPTPGVRDTPPVFLSPRATLGVWIFQAKPGEKPNAARRGRLEIQDLATGKVLATKTNSSFVGFDATGNKVLLWEDQTLCWNDARSGQVLETFTGIESAELTGNRLILWDKKGNRWRDHRERLTLGLWKKPVGDFHRIRIVDAAGQEELIRVTVPERAEAWLNDAGDLIWISQPHGETATTFCYDVPARRPWRLIFGIPLGVGLLVLALGWLFRHRPLR